LGKERGAIAVLGREGEGSSIAVFEKGEEGSIAVWEGERSAIVV
jgi:hypothetical protein